MNKFRCVTGIVSTLWLMLVGLSLSGQLCAAPAALSSTPSKPSLQSLSEPLVPSLRRPLAIKGYKTLSGTKILFIQTTGLSMFDVHVSFAAGSAHTAHKPGLAALTFSLLNEGVDGKDRDVIQETFDNLGAKLGMSISQDRASFSLRSLSDETRRAPALELFAQVLGKPLLSENALTGVKSQLLHFLDLQDQSYEFQANQALVGLLLPGHGYAQSIYGTRTGLASITQTQAQDFHREAYGAGNALITLVGDLSEEEAQRIGAQISNALPQRPAIAPLKKPVSSTTSQSLLRVERSSAQAYLRLAQPSVLRNSPDYVALEIASQIFTTRLMNDLRETRGLTYDVQASISALQAQGTLTIDLQTRPELADATVARIKEMFGDFLAYGPTQEELDNTKTRLTGSAPLNSASNAQILGQLHSISAHNLPLELDSSTETALELNLESVKTALNQHFDAQGWSAVILGPKTNQEPLPSPIESAANAMCRASGDFVAS